MSISVNKKSVLLFLCALAASLIFASFYGGPISYAWLYAVLLLIPFSALYVFLNYTFLRIFQEIEVHRLVKGEDHQYRAIIENAGFLPIHKMRLITLNDRCHLYDIADGRQISLDIHEKKELRSGISCLYAGSYNIGIEKVGFSDPFSLFTVSLNVPYTFRAVVSPQITNIADAFLELENLINNAGLKSPRRCEDTPGSDMRPYEKGDSLKFINWKVSARLSQWMTRVPDKMEKRTVTIVIQAAPVPDNNQDLAFLKRRDYFLELIVSAAWHFGGQGVPVRLIYPAGKISETLVDSYDSFMDFYSIVADGIFYNSREDYENIQMMATEQRSSGYDNGTWILIKEDPEPGESHCVIC